MNIDKINIRLKNIPPHLANDLVDGLGNEMLNEIIKSRKQIISNGNKINHIKIDKIDISPVKTQRQNQSPLDLQKLIANRIGQSISQAMGEKHCMDHNRDTGK